MHLQLDVSLSEHDAFYELPFFFNRKTTKVFIFQLFCVLLQSSIKFKTFYSVYSLANVSWSIEYSMTCFVSNSLLMGSIGELESSNCFSSTVVAPLVVALKFESFLVRTFLCPRQKASEIELELWMSSECSTISKACVFDESMSSCDNVEPLVVFALRIAFCSNCNSINFQRRLWSMGTNALMC